MFDMLFKRNNINRQKEAIAKRLSTDTAMLSEFENTYKYFELSSERNETMEKRQSAQVAPDDLVKRIVDELVNGCQIMKCQNNAVTKKTLTAQTQPVELSEITDLDEIIRPELTGMYMKRDVAQPAYIELMNMLMKFEKTGDKRFYHRFRQGLDILDLDPITYKMLSCNKNNMSYWLPKIADSVKANGFFIIPDTIIAKVPLTLLQLTRQEYASLSRTTLEIVDKWAKKVFELDDDRKYFLKTGTYSSKFDFRNAKVSDKKEVKDIGEYLLYIHYSALRMAHFDLYGKHPVVYGVSTTNEWVVRDYIEDKENNPCIYHGMPLHTEYRAFVDFDTKEVFGIHPYWDPDTMKNRFDNYSDNLSPDMLHDSVIYRAHESTLMKRFDENKNTVLKNIRKIIDDNAELTGQWSIDIMQNGDDFYLIDMAVAEQSAFYNKIVPADKRHAMKENWIPRIN